MGSLPDPSSASEPELSVVIPFHNEAGNAAALLTELRDALERIGVAAEIIGVDDGSTDSTLEILAATAQGRPLVRIIRFETNRGQAAALWAGLHGARGRWIATLDGDGQNPPHELLRLWQHKDEADMIVGLRQSRRDSWLRIAMSRTANRVRQFLLNDGVNDTGCSLKLFKRPVIGSFVPFRTLYSFMPAFARAAGWKVIEIPVAHRPRLAGRSHYGLWVMALLPLLDLLALSWLLKRRIPTGKDDRNGSPVG
ncbi:MAG: hypothetical protein RLZZ129_1345 [Verrucomicrobiota bacterium]|jgi:dolichol-phosphate mannosyltransferase